MASQLRFRTGQTKPKAGGLAAAAAADPFAPMTPAQINSTIAGYTSNLPKPLTDGQIRTSAQGMIDPLVARIAASINARAKAAGQAIGGYSGQLARDLGKIDYAAPYTGAETQQASVDAALRQSLAGGGSALADDLSTRLGQIGDPSVAAAAGGLADRGTAIGNTELAAGSSNLGALIANAASAKSYGQKLPGIARLAGLQDLSAANQAARQQIGDQTTQIETQLPSIVASLRSQSDSRAGNIASLAKDIYLTLTGQNVTKATAKAGFNSDAAKAGAPQGFSAGGGYYFLDPTTGRVSTAVPPQPKTYAPQAPKSVAPGNTLVDPSTGNVIYTAPPKAAAKPKPLAPSMIGEINDTVKFLHDGVPDTVNANGSTTPGKPAMNIGDALEFMREHGYLSTPQLAKIAIAALRRAYPGVEIKIAAGQAAGPPVPSATAPPPRQ